MNAADNNNLSKEQQYCCRTVKIKMSIMRRTYFFAEISTKSAYAKTINTNTNYACFTNTYNL